MKAIKPPKKPNPHGPLKSSVARNMPSNTVEVQFNELPRFVAQAIPRVLGSQIIVGQEAIEHTVLDRTCPQPDGTVKPQEICLCPGPSASNLIAAALNLYEKARIMADRAITKAGNRAEKISPTEEPAA